MNNADDTPAARRGFAGQIAEILTHLRTHSLAQSFVWIKGKDAPPLVQFVKYAFCGGVAFVVHNGVAYLLSRTVFPAFDGLSAAELSKNQIHANLVALAVSNVVAYVTNVLWVFTGGRHSRAKEFFLFSLVNAISGVAGIFAGPALRDNLGTNWWIAQASLIVTSTLVNFVCRKFFVFQK